MSFCEIYQDAVVGGDKAFLCDVLENGLTFETPLGHMEVCFLDQSKNIHTRWRPWLWVREHPEWVKLTNQRLISRSEIVFDLDPGPNETPQTFQERIRATHRALRDKGFLILNAYTTGSRGVHIHTLLHGLEVLQPEMRRKVKSFYLHRYQADPAKSTPRCMIALEGEPHWKSGKPKEVAPWTI